MNKLHDHLGNGGKLEMSLGCMDVPKMDLLSKSDPFCVLFLRDENDECKQLGMTETIIDTHTCKWVRKFFIDEELAASQLRFEVYDRDSERDRLKDHDFIGFVEGDIIASMLGRGDMYLKAPLARKGSKGNQGSLTIALDWIEKPEANFDLTFDVQVNYSVRTKMYYQVMKKTPESGQYVAVLRSKLLEKDVSKFESNALKLTQLCGGVTSRTFRIELFEFFPMGRSKVLGFIRTTVDELLQVGQRTAMEWSPCKNGLDKAKVFVSPKTSAGKPGKAFQISILE